MGYSNSPKYILIESFYLKISSQPPDDFVSVGKLSEQIRARSSEHHKIA